MRDNELTRDQQPNIPFAATVVQQPMSLNDSSIWHNQQPSSISAPVTQHPTSSQHAGTSQDQQPITRPEGQLGGTPPLTQDHAATSTEGPSPRRDLNTTIAPTPLPETVPHARTAQHKRRWLARRSPKIACRWRTALSHVHICYPIGFLLPVYSSLHVPASSVETTLIGHQKRPLSPNAETTATQRSRLVDASQCSLDSPYRRISSPDPLETEHA